MTPAWREAVIDDDVEQLERLLAAGTDLDALDRYGQSGLMLASRLGRARTVEWLIHQGAELDHAATFGLTATMLAVLNGHHHVVGLLVAAGADLTARGGGAPGFAGLTVLDLARGRGDEATVAILESGPR